MLISHGHRFIYTKTEKTGGTSVEAYLEPFCMRDGEWTLSHARDEYVSEAGIIGYRGSNQRVVNKWFSHMPAAAIRAQIGETAWASYFKFCVIRNPYDKIVSAFYFFRKHQPARLAHLVEDQVQFEFWLNAYGPLIDRNRYMIDGKFCLDDVIRYEILHDDLARICAGLGLPWNPDAVPTFKSGIRPKTATARSLYNEKSKRIVAAAYAFELERFGYAFPEEDRPVASFV